MITFDAGHTAADPGAIHGLLREHEIAVQVATQAAALLAEQEIDCQITPDDLDYWRVQGWALDNSDSGLVVFVHVNSGGGDYGAVFAATTSPEGRRAMTAIRASFAKAIPYEWNTYLVPSVGWDRAWNCIRRVTESEKPVCGVLVELPFIDAPDAAALYTPEGITRIAVALAEGIRKWKETTP